MKRLIISAVFALAAVGPAAAVDFNTKITNLDGSTPLDDKGRPVEMTIRTVCVNALLSTTESNVSGEEKFRRYELALHIQRGDDYKLSSEDIVLTKKLVNQTYASPLIVSQTWKALEEK